jgi:hypothetical protein
LHRSSGSTELTDSCSQSLTTSGPQRALHERYGSAIGQALYFDRDHQMFRLAVNAKDMSSRAEPTPLPIKGFAQAEYRRQFDLMSNGRQFLMLFPSSTRALAPASATTSQDAGAARTCELDCASLSFVRGVRL